MSSFLSKSKQRLEHTSKINVGEFKALQSLLSQEKNLLNSHVRVANDLRKASHALDEWAQSEGPDLADTLGKVAKLLANDLAKAEEEYADHLANFRMYFKQLRTREEKFSQLKKNKDTLQGKIDSAEKKLSKMSPEHKDLATWTQKLSDLRNEMVGMENSVFNEEAAIGDYRRQTARSAVSHQLAALCQLGEKMTIIGELGKLLTYEIRLDRTEPGTDRTMYNSFDRTMQIYGEAQTCLHKVVFDASNAEPAYSTLPVPSQGDFDQSYEYEQDAQRRSEEAGPRRKGNRRQSSSQDTSLKAGGGQYLVAQDSQHQSPSSAGQTYTDSRQEPAFQPLATPAHIGLEREFSDAIHSTWQQQENTTNEHNPYSQSEGVVMHAAPQAVSAAAQRQTTSDEYREEEQPPADPYGGAEYSREEENSYNEPEYIDESQMSPLATEPQHQHAGITTIEEETHSALQSTEVSSNRGVGGFSDPSATSDDRIQRHQLHDRPVPPDLEVQQDQHVAANHNLEEQSEAYDQNHASAFEEEEKRQDAQEPRQDFEPSGEDLVGTGLYGASGSHEASTSAPTLSNEEESDGQAPKSGREEGDSQRAPMDVPTIIAEAEREPEPVPLYTASPTVEGPPPVPPHDVAVQGSRPIPPALVSNISQQESHRTAPSPDLSAASALAAAAASSVKPRQASPSFVKSTHKQQISPTLAPSQHVYTTVATSNSKSPTTSVVPSSPTRRERTPPVKQQLYRSEHRNRHDSNEGMGRSSIAYLNDIPSLEPPMRAPPPVNLGMPLPSSSPYFNPYSNLRSNSGGPGDYSTSMGANSPASGRPKGARTSTLDTTLGSKHGFDLRSVQQAHERPLLQQPSPNLNMGAVRDKDYSYAIRTGDDGGGRRLAAGAFRRSNPSSSSIPSFRSANDDSTSPAQRLRDEWRNSQSVLPSPPTEFVTPAQTPGGLPVDRPASGYIDVGEDMYGERADSRAPLSHRTSAIDAPMDVIPNDDQSQPDLAHIAEGNEEAVLPLNVRKKSPAAASAEFPKRSTEAEGSEGFDGGQFVTKLE